MQPKQFDDKGHAGNGSFLDKRSEAEGITLRGRGVCIGDKTGLQKAFNVGIDDAAHGAVVGRIILTSH